MLAILLAIICDVVAGLILAGVLAALLIAAWPARPSGPAWLWGLALISILTVGTARRCLASGNTGCPPLRWVRWVISRRGGER